MITRTITHRDGIVTEKQFDLPMSYMVELLDPFQRVGIPVHQGGTLPLDNPNEHMPWEPWAENE